MIGSPPKKSSAPPNNLCFLQGAACAVIVTLGACCCDLRWAEAKEGRTADTRPGFLQRDPAGGGNRSAVRKCISGMASRKIRICTHRHPPPTLCLLTEIHLKGVQEHPIPLKSGNLRQKGEGSVKMYLKLHIPSEIRAAVECGRFVEGIPKGPLQQVSGGVAEMESYLQSWKFLSMHF